MKPTIPQVQKHRKKAKFDKVRKKEEAKESDDGDDDDSENLGEDSEDDDETSKSGGGWADAMASILRKEAPEGSAAVLAKSKDFAKAKEEEKKEFMERVKEVDSVFEIFIK